MSNTYPPMKKISATLLLSFLFVLLACYIPLHAGTISGFKGGSGLIDGKETSGALSTFSAGLASGCGDPGSCDPGNCGDSCSNSHPDCSGECSGDPCSGRAARHRYNYSYENYYDFYQEKSPEERSMKETARALKGGIPFEINYEYVSDNLNAIALWTLVTLGDSQFGIDLGFDHFEEKTPAGYDTLNIFSGDLSLLLSSDVSENTARAGIGLMGIGSVFTYEASIEVTVKIMDKAAITPKLSLGFFKNEIISDLLIRFEFEIFDNAKYFIGYRTMRSSTAEISGLQVGLGVTF